MSATLAMTDPIPWRHAWSQGGRRARDPVRDGTGPPRPDLLRSCRFPVSVPSCQAGPRRSMAGRTKPSMRSGVVPPRIPSDRAFHASARSRSSIAVSNACESSCNPCMVRTSSLRLRPRLRGPLPYQLSPSAAASPNGAADMTRVSVSLSWSAPMGLLTRASVLTGF